MAADYGFITYAFGKKTYRDMAEALVSSARLRGLALPFAVVTDSHCKPFCSLFDNVVGYRPEFGKGVVQKFHADLYSPFEKTIFVDSDCLFFKDPELVAAYYRDKCGFVVRGDGYVRHGQKYYSILDVDACLDSFNIDKFPLFNSGVFCFDRSNQARQVFEKARAVYAEKDKHHFKGFKGAPVNDEPTFAVAMELCGVSTLTADENFMSVALGDVKGLEEIDAVKGNGRYLKNGKQVDPAIIHFNIYQQHSFVYNRERLRLKLPRMPGAAALCSIGGRLISRWRWLRWWIQEQFSNIVVLPAKRLYRRILPKKKPAVHG